jgi:hypothetical protein
MKNEVSDVALFRYSVLGSLTSRINLAKGDVKKIINEQASELFDIPNSNRNKTDCTVFRCSQNPTVAGFF